MPTPTLPAAIVAPPSDRWSTPALVSYACLLINALTIAGVFYLAKTGATIDTFMAAIIGGVVTSTGNNVQNAVQYWNAGTATGKKNQEAVAQLAGAGAPSPAAPGTGTPEAKV